MAYPETRSVTNELHVGAQEGACNEVGKDWGGPDCCRTRPPMQEHDAWLDLPTENR